MATVFLFGAGASAFSGESYPSEPPLGKDLFRALVGLGGLASLVPADVASLFEDDFELGMAMFRERHDQHTPRFVREMAHYFAQFESGRRNLYTQLVGFFSDVRRRAIFATTNYELLIETAAAKCGLLVSYTAESCLPRNICVLKIHGSCNFLPTAKLEIDPSVGIFPGPSNAIVESPVRVVDRPEAARFCKESTLAPAMALYARGKMTLHAPSFVQRQQDEWRTQVAKASKLYVVGVRLHEEDAHVWEPLRLATAPLFYVAPDATEFEEWTANTGRRRAVQLADSFEASLPMILAHHRRG